MSSIDQQRKVLLQMREDIVERQSFVAMAARGRIHRSTGEPSPYKIGSSTTWLSQGLSAGYSHDDISRFYLSATLRESGGGTLEQDGFDGLSQRVVEFAHRKLHGDIAYELGFLVVFPRLNMTASEFWTCMEFEQRAGEFWEDVDFERRLDDCSEEEYAEFEQFMEEEDAGTPHRKGCKIDIYRGPWGWSVAVSHGDDLVWLGGDFTRWGDAVEKARSIVGKYLGEETVEHEYGDEGVHKLRP